MVVGIFYFILYLLLIVVKQVFPDFDMLGWYSTGEDPTDADIKVTFLSFTTILFSLSFQFIIYFCKFFVAVITI